MTQETKHKLQRSLDRELFIQALEETLDEYCDVRTDKATADEKRYMSTVIRGIISNIELKEDKKTPRPTSYE